MILTITPAHAAVDGAAFRSGILSANRRGDRLG